MGLSKGGGCADVSEDADLSDEGDDGLGGEASRWWVRYRFPRVCRELWEVLPNSLPFFFNFHRYVLLVGLERRSSSECG